MTEVLVSGAPIPTEGEVTFVRVTRSDRTSRTVRLLPGRQALRLTLRPGAYGVEIWHRFCDGNCAYLDPPGDRCSTRVSIRAGAASRLVVHNRPGFACRIVVSA
jgi:hypothetical protein